LGDSQLDMFGNKAKKGQLDLSIEHKAGVSIRKEDIETLIHTGEQFGENETRVLRKGKETKAYSHQLPESIRKNAKLIDDKLAEITVCDPAVGSGAFPVGMMSEIVKARNVLTTFVTQASKPEKEHKQDAYATYNFKRQCIEHSLYGVDIDPGAVEIAKLRLWLSLVVDEEDIKNIKPLPNLDYKVVCGNSLLGVEKDLFNAHLFLELEKLKPLFFNETNPAKKQDYKKQIDNLISKITNGHKEFDFEIYFSEVFHKKGGFDVVIANPPYIDSERMVGEGHLELRRTIAKTYKFTKGNWDIYIAFFEKGFKLLNFNGSLSYITPDKWISKPFGDALRISKIRNLLAILKAGREVFEDAKVDAIVSLFSNKNEEYVYVYLYETDIFLKDKILKEKIRSPYTLDALFSIGLKLIQKIDDTENSLAGNFLCENACATSDAYKLKPFIHENKGSALDSSTHFKIVNTGTIGKYFSKWGIKPMVYLGDNYLRPAIMQDEFFNNFKKAYSKKTLRPKIIMKGLNLLDAFLDKDGITIPGKTTLVITNKRNNLDELKLILALINSSLISYYTKEKYSASSYNQGVTFTKAMINSIPLPNISSSMRKSIISTVDRLLAIKEVNLYADTKALERAIDQLVYKLYDLTTEEIKIVEG
ncbi:MAG: Eco57I restriction-modification methylase domain-containing protein, partial [Deltaproteobacteria bacterium]|nr:Eco57I restriction-modification methylase domain-containing protein [Deltaproteobacteria bacterium]